MMRHFPRTALLGALFAGVAACSSDKLQIPSYNAPDVGGVAADPAGLQLLATGMLERERALAGATADQFGRFGRESYDFFPTDARNVSNYLTGISCSCIDPNTPGYNQKLDAAGFASGLYLNRFQNMRNAINLITALSATTLTQAQKDAGAGYARTFYGMDLLYIIESRDSLGSPVEITTDANAQPPFVSRDSVYKRIFAELDAADALLGSGSADFPFVLHAGYAGRGFGTVAGFRTFNRAVKARALTNYARIKRFNATADSPIDVAASTARYNEALTAIAASYRTPITSLASLDLGPQNVFSAASGDTPNGLSFVQNPNIIAHGSLATDTGAVVPGSGSGAPGAIAAPTGAPAGGQRGFVQPKTSGGVLDDRSTRKIVATAPRSAPSNFGIPGYFRFNNYPAVTSNGHILRNEELNLARIEALWFTGQQATALAELQNIRTISGGLTTPVNNRGVVITPASTTDFVPAFLYEATMSLLQEGRRWVMYRGFNRLNALPRDLVSGSNAHFYARVMPIPKAECDARRNTTNFPIQCAQP